MSHFNYNGSAHTYYEAVVAGRPHKGGLFNRGNAFRGCFPKIVNMLHSMLAQAGSE